MRVEEVIPFEASGFYKNYVSQDRVHAGTPLHILTAHFEAAGRYLAAIAPDRSGYRYAEGKWSVRELVGHVADTSLIFGTRMVSIGRGEKKNLPSFDEGTFAAAAIYEAMAWSEVLAAWQAVGRMVLSMIPTLNDAAWGRVGCAAGVAITPLQMLHSLVSHERHHFRVLHERYGLPGFS